MDELKLRAGEKIEAIHIAAKTAADSGKTRVQDVLNQTLEAINRLRESFREFWHNELIAESRARVAAWTRDAVQRIKEGTPPLSPVLLYEDLIALFKDRVWRRSVCIFVCGVALGGACGLVLGARAPPAPAPHARALHAHRDHGVILVDDAVAPGAGPGEVLVRVQAFSVCEADRAALRGHGAVLRALLGRSTVTVGRGFAGVVLDVGHGVDDLELGDEVWGCVSECSGGAASELLTIRSTRVSKRPTSLAADSAAALPWGAARALEALTRLQGDTDNFKGKRVCVCGGGGECCALVQALAARGASVSVLAPQAAHADMLQIGASEVIETTNNHSCISWSTLERRALESGPWDSIVAGGGAPPSCPREPRSLLKATSPHKTIVDLRPKAFLTDRLPTPLAFVFATAFYSFRILRWIAGCGTHTDWLESKYTLREGLTDIKQLVDEGKLVPVLDKVYLPQDFEAALAHACSDEAVGTTVIRFL